MARAICNIPVYDDGLVSYIYICNLCGQPLIRADDECNSGIHVGPDGTTKGKAIKSTDYVNMKKDG